MSYSKYGLTAVDAEGSDLDKGIISGPDGKFYQIDGFKHGQEDGLDKDKGAAFSGSLAADAAKAGFNPSDFNTAGDVENAINAIGGGGGDAPEMKGFHEPSDDLAMSKELSDAKERAQNWTKSKGMSGQVYGDGSKANPVKSIMTISKLIRLLRNQ